MQYLEAVTEGMDIVDRIADVATGSSGGHKDVPLDVITISLLLLVNEATLYIRHTFKRR